MTLEKHNTFDSKNIEMIEERGNIIAFYGPVAMYFEKITTRGDDIVWILDEEHTNIKPSWVFYESMLHICLEKLNR